MWGNVNVNGWRDYLVSRGISDDLAAEWARWTRRGIALSHTAPDTSDHSEIGISKFGGDPDLPPDVVWPDRAPYRYPPDMVHVHPLSAVPQPLDFLMQIDLAQIARLGVQLPLPESGLLLFFYDTQVQPWGEFSMEQSGFRVIYVPTGTQIERRAGPGRKSPSAEMILSVRESMPFMFWVHERLRRRIGYSREQLRAEIDKLTEDDFEEMTHSGHGLGGRPYEIQSTMEWQCQALAHGLDLNARPSAHRDLYAGIAPWCLLAQIDTDDDLDWCWGDSGKLYFWGRQDDIAIHQFDRLAMMLQCY